MGWRGWGAGGALVGNRQENCVAVFLVRGAWGVGRLCMAVFLARWAGGGWALQLRDIPGGSSWRVPAPQP